MSPSDQLSFNSARVSATRTAVASPLPSLSLSRDYIAQALANSPDHGATLDLSHKSISYVGEDGAEELLAVGRDQDPERGSSVVRIALAHNRLTTLPMAFALLSRLRYLVLKHNNFSVFPDVLMVMSSLEILDISRNKIKHLPSQPGSLINLRVFSIQRNKIHRLPPSFTQFHNLTLFKADQNPFEWPPKHIMDTNPSPPDTDTNIDWIRSVQKWIETNAAGSVERKLSDDSQGDRSVTEIDPDASLEESQPSSSIINESLSMHSRSFSLESDNSIYSDMASLHASHNPSPSRSPQPTRLRLDVLSSRSRGGSASASPSRSPGSYLPTPDESISSVDEDSSSQSRTQKNRPQLHGRNASSVTPSNVSRHRVFAKKSLPDLRPIHLFDNLPEFAGQPSRLVIHPPMPSPHRQDSVEFSSAAAMASSGISSFSRNRILTQDAISASPVNVDRPAPPMDIERNSYFRRLSLLGSAPTSKAIPPALLSLADAVRGILFALSQIYQTLQHYTVYAIDERLSAVLLKVLDPASVYLQQLINALDRFDTMSRRNLPSPAVCRAVVESCRDNVTVFGKAVGVLALQLKVLATHDDVRYTRQMLLVLYGAMAEISSAWSVIASQAETVKPLLKEHRPPPVLVKKVFPQQAGSVGMSVGIGRSAVVSPGPDTPIPPPLSTPPIPTVPHPRALLRSNPNAAALVEGKMRMSRRHAGSFSSKDVEIGKRLPSAVEGPQLSAGLAESATVTLRASRRPTIPVGGSGGGASPAFGAGNGGVYMPPMYARWDAHSRQGSQSSLNAAISSPSLGLRVPSLSALDVVSNGTSTLVDREALEAMKVAVEAAPAIWEMMDEILVEGETEEEGEGEQEGEGKEGRDGGKEEGVMAEALRRAKGVTERLRENILALESGNPSADRKGLREDAHVFVKTVIHLSNAIKTHGTSHPLSSILRTNMVKLTNATQEFVILLHVSSFSPAPTPRPYSPMVPMQSQTPVMPGANGGIGSGVGVGIGVPQTPTGQMDSDGRLGASLSRSRSAIPLTNTSIGMGTGMGLVGMNGGMVNGNGSMNGNVVGGGGGVMKLGRPPQRNGVPNPTFKIPTPPRFGMMRSRSGEEFSAVPG